MLTTLLFPEKMVLESDKITFIYGAIPLNKTRCIKFHFVSINLLLVLLLLLLTITRLTISHE